MKKKNLKKLIIGGVFSSGVAIAHAASMACGAGKCAAGKCGGNAPVEECFEQDAQGNCLDQNTTKSQKEKK